MNNPVERSIRARRRSCTEKAREPRGLGSFGEIVEALQIAVGSFRDGSWNWVRFVEALQIAVGSFRRVARVVSRMVTACPARVRRTRGTRNLARARISLPGFARIPWVRFATAHGIGFVSLRRYRLPWVRFVAGGKSGFEEWRDEKRAESGKLRKMVKTRWSGSQAILSR